MGDRVRGTSHSCDGVTSSYELFVVSLFYVLVMLFNSQLLLAGFFFVSFSNSI